MPISQEHITDRTPMGATVAEGGVTFRVWAPAARRVYVAADQSKPTAGRDWTPTEEHALVRRGGMWTGFAAGLGEGALYRFWVDGEGGSGFKRDPYARELGTDPAFPDCDCIVRASNSYPWHDQGYRPPEFRDLVIYQFHFGVYQAGDGSAAGARGPSMGKFLDLLFRIDHLRDLGVNAVQPLPIQEYPSEFSMGYNGTDYFSPESDYQVESDADLARYMDEANRILAARGQGPITVRDLRPGPNQLKCVIDLCHLNGIAVILDVVYNHAGGGFDPQSIYFMDRQPATTNNNSLYFTERDWAGGLVFAFWKDEVRQFLIDNAMFFLDEYHADGFRYDEVTVIHRYGGWRFAQDLAATVRYAKPKAIQIAEYWGDERALAVSAPPQGMGFDAALSDRLRDSVRHAIRQASFGSDAHVPMDAIAASLHAPPGFPAAWRAVNCVENHDVVHAGREPRIAALGDGRPGRSWWGRSRARAASALLLTAPGIPMLFMGQEILEDKQWSDDPLHSRNTLIWWDGLHTDRAMQDHLAFMRDLVACRHRHAALQSDFVNVSTVHNESRILAFHRWTDNGEDAFVIFSLNDATLTGYELGFPRGGWWREVFNSDFYDHLPNPWVSGNAGGVSAAGRAMHGFEQSASVTIPANAVLVFVGS
ncbi:alpha-amylase family glycosyl hydrolase (plasmid) [Azospirillum sp. A26]|uniref:alpha amylase C-terminal domain-containing protein n=1 Tax=Azospirillum sp. A26 TaxID=3160607 RepID=UPI00366B35CB